MAENFCSNCGKPLLQDDKFCSACGESTVRAKIDAPTAPTTPYYDPRPSLEACSEEEGLWPQELWVEG